MVLAHRASRQKVPAQARTKRIPTSDDANFRQRAISIPDQNMFEFEQRTEVKPRMFCFIHESTRQRIRSTTRQVDRSSCTWRPTCARMNMAAAKMVAGVWNRTTFLQLMRRPTPPGCFSTVRASEPKGALFPLQRASPTIPEPRRSFRQVCRRRRIASHFPISRMSPASSFRARASAGVNQRNSRLSSLATGVAFSGAMSIQRTS